MSESSKGQLRSEKYTYLTIVQNSIFEFKERGSKFIGVSARVNNEDEIKLKLQEWQGKYPLSTHICYAYRLGVEGKIYRANDDGEPSNSAGAPILGQIDALGVTNTLVGVVRYYGGTKLGVGGLMSAYKLAAKEVLDESKTIKVFLYRHFKLTMNYIDMPFVMDWIKRNRVAISSTNMEMECSIIITLEPTVEVNWEENLGMYTSLIVSDIGVF